MACTVGFEYRGNGGVATLAGSLTAATAGDLQERFMAWLSGAPEMRVIALDVESLEFIDSAGLGMLMAALRAIGDRGGSLKLVRPGRKIRMLLDITRLHKVFDVCESVEAALADSGETG